MPHPTCLRSGCGQAAGTLPVKGGAVCVYCSLECAAVDALLTVQAMRTEWCNKHGGWRWGKPCQDCEREKAGTLKPTAVGRGRAGK